MDKPRVTPLLAGAVMALSLSACQGMMGGERSGTAQTSSTATAPAGQQAASADLVRDVQRGLATRGYDVGPQDGVYGTATEQALRRFQQDQHMAANGQIDAQTLAALGVAGGGAAAGQRASAAPSSPSRDYVPTSRRQGASAAPARAAQSRQLAQAQVRDVQQTLSDRGYDPGKVDGRWGPHTTAALRNFQHDQNLRASGRPDSQTLAALGVESGSPATQTGQLPEAQRRGTAIAPEPENNPSDTDLQQRDVTHPEQQQGLLPPTGSQAPGAARESERAPVAPGGAPDTRPQPEQAPDVVPAPR